MILLKLIDFVFVIVNWIDVDDDDDQEWNIKIPGIVIILSEVCKDCKVIISLENNLPQSHIITYLFQLIFSILSSYFHYISIHTSFSLTAFLSQFVVAFESS